MLKHERKDTIECLNWKNNHIIRLLTKEKYGTRNLSHGNFNIPPLHFYLSTETETIIMKSLSSLENTTLALSITFEYIGKEPIPYLQFEI